MASSTSQASTPRPILSRKLDLFYVVYLAFSIFLYFALDFPQHLPSNTPEWIMATNKWYVAKYNDPLYIKDPTFFHVYVVIEVLYSVPVSIWCIRGLVRDDPAISLHFLVLATHIISSTLVCTGELLGAKDWPKEDIDKNLPGYVGFLIISILLWFDMFSRVRREMTGKTKLN